MIKSKAKKEEFRGAEMSKKNSVRDIKFKQLAPDKELDMLDEIIPKAYSDAKSATGDANKKWSHYHKLRRRRNIVSKKAKPSKKHEVVLMPYFEPVEPFNIIPPVVHFLIGEHFSYNEYLKMFDDNGKPRPAKILEIFGEHMDEFWWDSFFQQTMDYVDFGKKPVRRKRRTNG